MANRMLRDCTDSENVDKLSAHAEVLFYRLMMKADDYGSFYGNVKLIKSNCYPLRIDTVRDADISRWMDELLKAGLIVVYMNAGKTFLRINNFGQRLRNKKKRFPDCPPELLNETDMPQPAATGGNPPPEVELEVELEVEEEATLAPPSILSEGLIYDIESDLLKNQIVFEQICCASGKSKEAAFESLKKYHLWLQRESQYPKQKKALQAGFQLWLMNEKATTSKVDKPVKPGPSAREIEEAENRKKLGI
jgi:hypothetical protein